MPQNREPFSILLNIQLLIFLVGESSVPPPLKPNLIELGRYRKIDRESVTCRWRFRTWAWEDLKKVGTDQMNSESELGELI